MNETQADQLDSGAHFKACGTLDVPERIMSPGRCDTWHHKRESFTSACPPCRRTSARRRGCRSSPSASSARCTPAPRWSFNTAAQESDVSQRSLSAGSRLAHATVTAPHSCALNSSIPNGRFLGTKRSTWNLFVTYFFLFFYFYWVGMAKDVLVEAKHT